MSLEIFVPRLMDADNRNAQNANARAILRSWSAKHAHVRALTYGVPDAEVARNPLIKCTRLWRRHAWVAHLFLSYLKPCNAIFYPGVHASDFAGLRWRRRLGLDAPVIATLEGLVGDSEREAEYSRLAGHTVHCQRVPRIVLESLDALYRQANHIIAISPFLARMGAAHYGEKVSFLPLGIDTDLFHPPVNRDSTQQTLVVSAGRVASHKRPEIFLDLAQRYANAHFMWFGEGNERYSMIAEANIRRLKNVEFPGERCPAELGEAFRRADIFVLPSLSEGAPKVAQEAAACGLPVIAFGFYEPPSVADGTNGYVVWNDSALFDRVGQLLGDPKQAKEMGDIGARMAKDSSWRAVAPMWEQKILDAIGSRPGDDLIARA